MSTVEKYSLGSRIIHWFVAFIVISLLIMGFYLSDLPSSFKPLAYMLHKSFGLTIIALMVLRFIWLVRTGKPKLPLSVPKWQRLAARGVQHGFYVLLLVMPLAGWVMSTAANKIPAYFGLFLLPFPGVSPDKQLAKLMFDIHSIVGWVLVGLVVLHIAGALKHYFINKDDVLQRML